MAPGIGDSMTGDGTIGDGTIGLGHHGDGIDGVGTHGPGLLGVGIIGPGTTTSTETATTKSAGIQMSIEDQIRQLRGPDLWTQIAGVTQEFEGTQVLSEETEEL